MKHNTGIQMLVLAAVPFIMVLGNSMLIPLLPAFEKFLNVSAAKSGLFITMFSLSAGLVIPVAGFLSDRVGRKTVMAPALVVYGLGGIVSGLGAIWLRERAYPVMLAGRLIQGIGAGGTYQLAMALVGDVFQTSERAKSLGILESANALGKVVSPVAGAALGLVSWFMPFFVYAALAVPAGVAVWLVVREPRQQKTPPDLSKYFGDFQRIFRRHAGALVVVFLSGAIVLWALFGWLSYYSDLLETPYGIVGIKKGLVLAVPVLVLATLSYVVGVMQQKNLARFSRAGLALGLGLVAAAMAMGIFLRHLFALSGLLVLLAAGTGLVLPALNLLATSVAPLDERGLLTCLYGTVRFFGVAIGPPVFGWAQKNLTPVMLAGAVLAATALVLALWLVHPQRILGRQFSGPSAKDQTKGQSPRPRSAGQWEPHVKTPPPKASR